MILCFLYRLSAWRMIILLSAETVQFSIVFPELRSSWPVVQKRELWEQPFWNNKGNKQILPILFTAQSASMTHAWNGCSQSSRFPTAGQGEQSSGNMIAQFYEKINHNAKEGHWKCLGWRGIPTSKTLKGKHEQAKQAFLRNGRGETKNFP